MLSCMATMGASSAEVTGGRPVRLLTVRMFMVTDFVTGDVSFGRGFGRAAPSYVMLYVHPVTLLDESVRR